MLRSRCESIVVAVVACAAIAGADSIHPNPALVLSAVLGLGFLALSIAKSKVYAHVMMRLR